MKDWRLVFSLLLLLLLTMLSASSGRSSSNRETKTKRPHIRETKTKRPHIIFILADDLGYNDVSWHNPSVQTPHMDQLARTGIILEQSYVLPKCTPTRAALLTGKHPYTFGRQGRVIKPMEPIGIPTRFKLLPEVLKETGYDTHAIGKWHLGFCSSSYTPTKRGFDSFYGFYTGAQSYFTHSLPGGVPINKQRGCVHKCYDQFGLDFYNNTTPDPTQNGVYSTHVFASQAEELLKKRNPKRPLFLYLPLQSVHAPLEVPHEYMTPFRYVRDVKRRRYLGMVSAMDEAVGRVVKALKSSRHYDNSVIIFTSDNGGALPKGGNNWPLCGKKGTLLEGATRAAAFVHSPLLRKSFTSHKLIHVTDWYSTLVSLAGGQIPEDTHGYDQWLALTTSAPSPRTDMIYNIDFKDSFQAGVRDDRFKLIIGDEENRREWRPPSEHQYQNRRRRRRIASVKSHNINGIRLRQNTTSFSEGIDDLQDIAAPSSNWKHGTTTLEITSESPVPGVFSGGSDTLVTDRSVSDSVTVTDNSDRSDVPDGKRWSGMTSIEGDTKRVNIHQYHVKNLTFINYKTRYSDSLEVQEANENAPKMKIHSREKRRLAKPLLKKKNNRKTSKTKIKDDWVTFEELGVNTKKYHRLKNFINRKTKLSLFDIRSDPEERTNIAKKKHRKVKKLLKYLHRQMKHYVPPETLPDEPDANPRFWNNAWSPGWCEAAY